MLTPMRAVLGIACLCVCSCTKKVLPSVCLPNVSSDVDSLTLIGALLPPKLPIGATPSVQWSDKGERMFVAYRGRKYEITRRKSRQGACFDFSPPIPLNEASQAEPRIRWEDRAASVLS